MCTWSEYFQDDSNGCLVEHGNGHDFGEMEDDLLLIGSACLRHVGVWSEVRRTQGLPGFRTRALDLFLGDPGHVALAGGAPEYVPFTFYDLLYPQGFDASQLQSKGMAVCARREVFRKVMPNVKVTEVNQPDGGVRTCYTTPIGVLTAVMQPAAVGMAPAEHPIKSRDDYRIAKFIVDDTRYEPAYEAFLEEQKKIGDAGKTIAHTSYEPLLDIQLVWLGQERFCYEIADNEDAVMERFCRKAPRQGQEDLMPLGCGQSDYS